MLWLKAFHLIFAVTWFAALFYLPRLFVYHAMTDDRPSHTRFCVMERKLFWGIMTPSAGLCLGCGIPLWLGYGFGGAWLTAKLGLVGVLLIYHGWCYWVVRVFAQARNCRSHSFYRWMNEVPALLLVGIILLAVFKPS